MSGGFFSVLKFQMSQFHDLFKLAKLLLRLLSEQSTGLPGLAVSEPNLAQPLVFALLDIQYQPKLLTPHLCLLNN